MTPQTESQKKNQQHTAPNFSRPEGKDAGAQKTEPQNKPISSFIAHQNFIKPTFRKTGQLYKMGRQQYDKMPANQRLGAGVALFVLLFWPLFGLVMLSPWILAAIVFVYSALFGFTTFIQDLEEAITSEMPLSENTNDMVKNFSKNVQTNWVVTKATEYGLIAYELIKEHGSKLIVLGQEKLETLKESKIAGAATKNNVKAENKKD